MARIDALIRDELIRRDALGQLVRDGRIDPSKIKVEVSNGMVTLTGEVPTYLAHRSAEIHTRGVSGVTDVENRLFIRYPVPAIIALTL